MPLDDLWARACSTGLRGANIATLHRVVRDLRPESVQDLKPMLILCQSLLHEILEGRLLDNQKELDALRRAGK